MTELICITCPKGCHLKIDEQNGYKVTGNACPRGEVYGKTEVSNPVRMVTSTVRIQGAKGNRLSVKTDHPLPKKMIFDCMKALDTVVAVAPVRVGDVILPQVCGTDVNIVATKSM